MTERAIVRQPVTIPVNVENAAPRAMLDELHELRVRIPVDLHRQLLSLKILRGRSLADSVSQALDLYFEAGAPTAADMRDDA